MDLVEDLEGSGKGVMLVGQHSFFFLQRAMSIEIQKV